MNQFYIYLAYTCKCNKSRLQVTIRLATFLSCFLLDIMGYCWYDVVCSAGSTRIDIANTLEVLHLRNGTTNSIKRGYCGNYTGVQQIWQWYHFENASYSSLLLSYLIVVVCVTVSKDLANILPKRCNVQSLGLQSVVQSSNQIWAIQ